MRDDDDDDDDGSGGDDDDVSGRGRLNGVRAPADEYWSDGESGGARLADASEAGAESAQPVSSPWGAQKQRKLGGPRVEEPVTTALLARLLVYALAYSACLTGCEVLTMWVSRRVSWALQPGLLFGALWGATRCACLFALPFCWLCAYGLLKHPAVWKEMIPPRRKVLDEMFSGRIFFRQVCMLDDNQQLAQACISHTVSMLQRTLPEVTWRVELVCEGLPFWEPPSAVHVVAVPSAYAPVNGTQGRARARHYATLHSTATPGDWVVYLGAASVLRERTVDAILAHVVDEAFRLALARQQNERNSVQYGRIAQGPMCVGRTGGSWLGFLSDTRRAGQAYGLLRWQYEAGEAWAGVEESFLVVPKELEVAVGFDHGPHAGGADLTLFALLCRDWGARFSWLDAPTEEPAPLTPSDFLERRRRAMACRLLALATSGDRIPGALSVDRRVALAIMTVSSMCAQLCLVVTALSIIIQHQVSISELAVSFVISFCSGTVLFCYMLGLASSCSPLSFGGRPAGWVVFCTLLLAQALWAPVASFLELIACGQALRTHLQTDVWRQAR